MLIWLCGTWKYPYPHPTLDFLWASGILKMWDRAPKKSAWEANKPLEGQHVLQSSLKHFHLALHYYTIHQVQLKCFNNLVQSRCSYKEGGRKLMPTWSLTGWFIVTLQHICIFWLGICKLIVLKKWSTKLIISIAHQAEWGKQMWQCCCCLNDQRWQALQVH